MFVKCLVHRNTEWNFDQKKYFECRYLRTSESRVTILLYCSEEVYGKYNKFTVLLRYGAPLEYTCDKIIIIYLHRTPPFSAETSIKLDAIVV